MKLNSAFPLLLIFLTTIALAEPKVPCSALLLAERSEKTAIPAGFVAGWDAIFNGDVHRSPEGYLFGAFRMARNGYYKKPNEKSPRHYEMANYITDIGIFSSIDEGATWKFEKMVFAAQYGVEKQIQYLKNLLEMPLQEATRDRTQRALGSLLEIEKSRLGNTDVLEDPRFMFVTNSQGAEETYLFVTSVPVGRLIEGQNFGEQKSYQMKALKVSLHRDTNFALDHVTILKHQYFGPEENKDNWVINVEFNEAQKNQVKKLYRRLGWNYKEDAHPVLLSTRVNGAIQSIPFAKLEDIFKPTAEQWKMIVASPDLYTTLVKPDGLRAKSVGNNDQPFKVKVPGFEKYYWHFYHETGLEPNLVYSTWVQILDEHGTPVARLPYAIQTPSTETELQGDIPYVVFNSGHYRFVSADGRIQLVHVNGTGDRNVEMSLNQEDSLFHEVMTGRRQTIPHD